MIMRKIVLIFLIYFGLTSLFSCKKDETKAVLKSDLSTSLTAPPSNITLLESEKTNILTFNWTVLDCGFPASVKYTIQLSATEDFAEPVALLTSYSASGSTTVGDFNTKILGLDIYNPATVYMRVACWINDNVDIVYSNVASPTITPYSFPKLVVNGTGSSIFSVKSDGNFEGYLNFTSATTITFTDADGHAWGDDGGDLIQNGAAIPIPSAGYYRIQANPSSGTYSLLKTEWGLIGDATPGGWGSDTNLTYDPVTQVWTLTVDLTKAKIKFRANDDWGLNYGDNAGDGTLQGNGSDISVPSAGNYTITLKLSTPIYKYKMKKN
jgi:starch-binding outer membrane protein SusE/F